MSKRVFCLLLTCAVIFSILSAGFNSGKVYGETIFVYDSSAGAEQNQPDEIYSHDRLEDGSVIEINWDPDDTGIYPSRTVPVKGEDGNAEEDPFKPGYLCLPEDTKIYDSDEPEGDDYRILTSETVVYADKRLPDDKGYRIRYYESNSERKGVIPKTGEFYTERQSLDYELDSWHKEEAHQFEEGFVLLPASLKEPEKKTDEIILESENNIPETVSLDNTGSGVHSEITISWEPENPAYNGPVTITVTAPGAEKIRLFESGDPLQTFDSDSGEYTAVLENREFLLLKADACFNGVWSEKTGTRTVYYRILGTLDPVKADVPNTVTRGKLLPVSFERDDYRKKFSYCYYPSAESDCREGQWSGLTENGNSFEIETADLEAGNYVLELRSEAEGYRDGVSKYYFEVEAPRAVYTDQAKTVNDITLTVSPQKIRTEETITISVTAPDAEKIEIYRIYTSNGETRESLYQSVEGDSFEYRTTYISATKFKLAARACFDGVWTEKTDPVECEVTSDGKLGGINAIVPAAITEGTDLSVSFEAVEHAEFYLYCVRPDTESSCRRYNSVQTGSLQFTAETGALETGSYYLDMQARATGWDYSRASFSFDIEASGAEKPEAPSVVMESDSILLNRSIVFFVKTPEVEKIRYRVNGPYSWSGTDDLDYPQYDGTSYRVYANGGASTAGSYTLQASVMTGGVWSSYSDPVSFTIVSLGDLEAPQISVPSQITIGEDLPVTITKVEHAEYYSVTIYSENNSYITSSTAFDDDPGVHVVSMAGIAEGTYKVQVYVYAAGYKTAYTDYYPFTIVGTLAEAPVVTPDKTSIPKNGTINFTVTAPGAEKIRYQFYETDTYNPDVAASGDTTVISLSGTDIYYRERIRFSAYRSGAWSAWTDWIEFEVTDMIQLEKPEITVPGQAFQGQRINITITPVEHADGYWIVIYEHIDDHDTDNWVYSEYFAETTVKVNADFDPGTYRVRVYASDSTGQYAESEFAWADLEVIESVNTVKPPTLTVSKNEIYVNEYYEVTAAVEAGETVEFVIEDSVSQSSDSKTVNTANGMAGFRGSYSGPCTLTITARVLSGDIWSEYSTPVTVSVLSLGKLTILSTDIPDTVQAMTDLTFTASVQDDAEKLWGWLYRWNDDPDGSRPEDGIPLSNKSLYPDRTGGRTFTVAGIDLPEGLYEVVLYASASKWETSEAYSQEFRVVGTTLLPTLTLTASAEEIWVNDEITLSLTGENIINYIEVTVYDNDEWMATVPLEPENQSNSFTYNKWITPGSHELYAKYEEYESPKINVTVKSEGKLETPAVSAARIQYVADQDNRLIFTIDPVEHADGYVVSVVSKKDPDNRPLQRDIPYSGDEPYETSVEWNRAGLYVISCTAYGAHYEASDVSEGFEVETFDYALHAHEIIKDGKRIRLKYPVVRTLNIGSGIVGDDTSGATQDDPLIIPVNTTKSFWIEEDPIDLPKGSTRTVYWILKSLDDPDAEEVCIASDSFIMANQTMSYKFEEMGNFVMYWVALVDDTVVSFTRDWYVKVTGPILTADPLEVYVGDPVTFTVEHQDPTGTVTITAEDIDDALLTLELANGTAEGIYFFEESGIYSITAHAGGYESAPVTVKVKSEGKLKDPTVTIDDAVPLNSDVMVGWTRVDLAETYDLCVMFNGETVYRATISQTAAGDIQTSIPGTAVTQKGTYTVEVTAKAKHYDPGKGTSEFEASDSAMTFTMSPTEVKTGDPVSFTVTAPGVERVRLVVDGVRYYDDDEHDLTNGKASFTRPFTQSGSEENDNYRLVTFDIFRNGEWESDKMPVRKLKVTAAGKLADIEVTAPERLLFGKDLKFSWKAIDYADWYYIYFQRNGETVFPRRQVQALAGIYTYEQTISAADIPEADTYTVTVMASGKNYDQSSGSARTEVFDKLPGPKITVPSENEELTETELTACWEAVDEATSYSISLAKKNENGEYEKVWAAGSETVNVGTALSYPISGLVYGGEYRVAVSSNLTDPQTGVEKPMGWSERLFTVKLPSISISIIPENPTGFEKKDLEISAVITPAETVAYLIEPDGSEQYSSGDADENSRTFKFKIRQETAGEYSYTIRAYGTGELSGMQDAALTFTVVFNERGTIPAPEVTNLSNGDIVAEKNYTVKWDPVTPPDEITLGGYYVDFYRRNPETEGWDPIAGAHKSVGMETEFKLPGLDSDGEYRFEVFAFEEGNDPHDSKGDVTVREFSYQTGTFPAPEITNLSDGDILMSKDFTVKWNPVTPPEDITLGGYYVEFSRKNPSTGTWEQTAGESVGLATEFRIAGMEIGGKYRIKVFAFEQGKEPQDSKKIDAIREFSCMTIPSFTVSLDSKNTYLPDDPVTINWTAPVWPGHPDQKPDCYVIWWSGPGLASYSDSESMPVRVENDTFSYTLNGLYTSKPGSYNFNVYAMLERDGKGTQTMADGPDMFIIGTPEIHIQKPDKGVNPYGDYGAIEVSGTVSDSIDILRMWIYDKEAQKFLKLANEEPGCPPDSSHIVVNVNDDNTFRAGIILADNDYLRPTQQEVGGNFTERYVLHVYGYLPGRTKESVQELKTIDVYRPYMKVKLNGTALDHPQTIKENGKDVLVNPYNQTGNTIRVTGEAYYGIHAVHVVIYKNGAKIRLKDEARDKDGNNLGFVVTTVNYDPDDSDNKKYSHIKYKGTFDLLVEPEEDFDINGEYQMYIVGYIPWQDHVDPADGNSDYKSFPQSTFGVNKDYFRIPMTVQPETSKLYITTGSSTNQYSYYKDLFTDETFHVYMQTDSRASYASYTTAGRFDSQLSDGKDKSGKTILFDFGVPPVYGKQGHYRISGETNFGASNAIDIYVKEHVPEMKLTYIGLPDGSLPPIWNMPGAYGYRVESPQVGTELTVTGEYRAEDGTEYWYVYYNNDPARDGFVLKSAVSGGHHGFITPDENQPVAIWNGENLHISWYQEPQISSYNINIYGSWIADNGSDVKRWLYSSGFLSSDERVLELSSEDFRGLPADREITITIELMGSADGGEPKKLYERKCVFLIKLNEGKPIGNNWWYLVRGDGLRIWNSKPEDLKGKYYLSWENVLDGSAKDFRVVELYLSAKNSPDPYDKVYDMSSTLKMQKGKIYRVYIKDNSENEIQASFDIAYGEDRDVIWAPARGQKIKAWNSGTKILDIRWRALPEAKSYDVILEVIPSGKKTPVEIFRQTVDANAPADGILKKITGTKALYGDSMDGYQLTITSEALLKNFTGSMKQHDMTATVRIVVHK